MKIADMCPVTTKQDMENNAEFNEKMRDKVNRLVEIVQKMDDRLRALDNKGMTAKTRDPDTSDVDTIAAP